MIFIGSDQPFSFLVASPTPKSSFIFLSSFVRCLSDFVFVLWLRNKQFLSRTREVTGSHALSLRTHLQDLRLSFSHWKWIHHHLDLPSSFLTSNKPFFDISYVVDTFPLPPPPFLAFSRLSVQEGLIVFPIDLERMKVNMLVAFKQDVKYLGWCVFWIKYNFRFTKMKTSPWNWASIVFWTLKKLSFIKW